MKPIYIEARDLPDAWFQALYLLSGSEGVHEYVIERGSFKGQRRREFDFVTINVKYPGVRPLIPDIPPELGIPAPTSIEYVEEYLQYLMTDYRKENEGYTYGERITNPKVIIEGREYVCGVHPMKEVIEIYKRGEHGTNQAIMEIGMPQDILLDDPPCLRLIDTRVINGKLSFCTYWRSWELWAGLSSNLACLQLMKEYMCHEIGLEDGPMIAVSKGLHLYEYSFDLWLKRINKSRYGDSENDGQTCLL